MRRALAAATAAAVELRTQLREDTPKDTGRTSRGWNTTSPTFTGTGITFSIRHPQDRENPPDPRWLSSGTNAHPIYPVRAKMLAFPGSPGANRHGEVFPTKTTGPIVFRSMVHHPGFAGTGFIERILAEDNVSEVFRRAFAQSR